ncbi:hypothetical protein MMC19_005258 [Ptychographa xylographoides]|nr:hypothetical protein [Ptychographa xylographoides]
MSPSPSYMTREALSTFLLQPKHTRPSLAIIDVRDNDHVGGHIYSSTHVPSATLDYKIPELARTLRDKDIVIFHCALSQQRGPTAARRYARECSRLINAKNDIGIAADTGTQNSREDVEGGQAREAQKVYILDGGFLKWQEKCVKFLPRSTIQEYLLGIGP